jgi:hypothetical protein
MTTLINKNLLLSSEVYKNLSLVTAERYKQRENPREMGDWILTPKSDYLDKSKMSEYSRIESVTDFSIEPSSYDLLESDFTANELLLDLMTEQIKSLNREIINLTKHLRLTLDKMDQMK